MATLQFNTHDLLVESPHLGTTPLQRLVHIAVLAVQESRDAGQLRYLVAEAEEELAELYANQMEFDEQPFEDQEDWS